MSRGRTPIPEAVKALRGNPGHRKKQLAAGAAEPSSWIAAGETAIARSLAGYEVPDWLTSERARRIFKSVVEDYLQRRIIRAPDFICAGRWAHYLDLWIAGMDPDTSAGLDRLVAIERVMRPLEDRLGLSPLARQDILRGLSAMPAAIGDMLTDEKPRSGVTPPVGETGGDPIADELPSSASSLVSPLGFLKLQ